MLECKIRVTIVVNTDSFSRKELKVKVISVTSDEGKDH